MAYVNKNEALRVLPNPNDFDFYKNMFIKLYDKNLIQKINQTYNDNQYDDLYEIISNLKNMSEFIGSSILTDETFDLLSNINANSVPKEKIDELTEVLEIIYTELKNIK